MEWILRDRDEDVGGNLQGGDEHFDEKRDAGTPAEVRAVMKISSAEAGLSSRAVFNICQYVLMGGRGKWRDGPCMNSVMCPWMSGMYLNLEYAPVKPTLPQISFALAMTAAGNALGVEQSADLVARVDDHKRRRIVAVLLGLIKHALNLEKRRRPSRSLVEVARKGTGEVPGEGCGYKLRSASMRSKKPEHLRRHRL
jgi:hypothetical protein